MSGSPSAGDPASYPRPGIVASRWEGEAFRTSSRLPFSGIVYPVPGPGRVGFIWPPVVVTGSLPVTVLGCLRCC